VSIGRGPVPQTSPGGRAASSRREVVRLHGVRLAFARAAWGGLALLALIVYLIAIPADYAQLSQAHAEPKLWTYLSLEQVVFLAVQGVQPQAYAFYMTVLQLVVVAIFWAVGLAILFRRSDEAMALFAAGTAIVFGTTSVATTLSLLEAQPEWQLPVDILTAAGLGTVLLLFYLFPDRRFVPDWTKWLGGLWVAWMIVWPFYPAASPNELPEPLPWLVKFVPLATGVAAQVYRYRYYSSPGERQQTKWVVWGFGLAVAGFFVFNLWWEVVPALRRHGAERLLYLLLGYPLLSLLPLLLAPLALAFAALRYRLWDIDVIIRRTLIYATVTAVLAGLYYGSVVALQEGLRALTGQGSALAIAVSTLAIALLFSPMRSRAQKLVDQRFYRRQYDGEKVLADFAGVARDEVDLEQLAGKLLDVVEETMKPSYSSLWLRDTPRPLVGRARSEVR
jgi:hypothetical protein